MPDAGVLATILLIVGLFLLALELMIPSFGMIGILSAIVLVISAWSAWQAWWGTSPGFFWTYCAFWLLGIPSVLGGMLFVLQNTSIGDRIVLRGPASEHSGLSAIKHNKLEALVGQTGVTASMLTPGGMVTIDNQRFHAESPGMMIDPGTPIEVLDVRGSRLLVRIYDDSKTADSKTELKPQPASLADTVAAADISNASVTDDRAGEDEGVLDFEIPES